MTQQAKPPEPPIQREDYDLTAVKCGEKMAIENAPPIMSHEPADFRSPAAMMRSMGFDPVGKMTPLQFLVAVMNDDVDLIYKDQKKRERTMKKGGFGITYRIECAKTASRFIHMEMPKVSITDESGNFGETLARAVRNGDERIRTRTMIIETVERLSPETAPASYPAMYQKQGPVIDSDGMVDGEVLNPEGERGYNPDDDS